MAIFSPKVDIETEVFTADFTRILPAGVTLVSGAVYCSVLDGIDAAAPSMPQGSAVVTANQLGDPAHALSQRIGAGVIGNRYLLEFRGTASDGTTPVIQGDFWVDEQIT